MDLAAMNAILDFTFGADAHPDAPTSHELALFYGDPRDLGTELDGTGGYARATVAAADWSPAADGQKSVSDWVAFPATSGEWSSEATHWALIASGDIWASGAFADPLVVTSAGDAPEVRVTVVWVDSLVPNEG